MSINQNKRTITRNIYAGILLFIFGAIILHAPLSVGLGTLFPDYKLLIKSWKEILMVIACLMGVFLVFQNKQQAKIIKDPIMIVIGLYIMLNLVIALAGIDNLTAVGAGLAINLRYVVFFGLVYVLLSIYPQYKKFFIRLGIAGALTLVVFAVLQVFVLPHDILKYLGYNNQTIAPYLTIDRNYDFVRINSTLRGPNSLGAYAVMVMALMTSFLAKNKINKKRQFKVLVAILFFGSVIALWASYSRSAFIAAVISIIVVLFIALYKKVSLRLWLAAGAVLVILCAGFFALPSGNYFFSNVVLHNNPASNSTSSSNGEHISSLKDGFVQLLNQPFGAGIGSTGSASLYTDRPEIIENQYLFIAHESGWLGLGLFLFIFVCILKRLWKKRSDWLALGVFVSGIGLALIGLVLPVWVDDTVSIIWWGMAAVALIKYVDKRRKIVTSKDLDN